VDFLTIFYYTVFIHYSTQAFDYVASVVLPSQLLFLF